MTTTTFNQTIAATFADRTSAPSFLNKFYSWCKAQESNRLLWLGLIIAIHGCVLTPVTIMTVVFAGNSLFLFMSGMVAMVAALVTNLAAMPTKITLPVFALSLLIDLAIIVSCFVTGFNVDRIFM